MSKIRRAAPIVILAITLAACSNTTAPTNDKPVELTGSGPANLWVRAADEPMDKALVTAWNTANPDRKITMLTVPDAQYVQKFVQAVRGGDAPDLAAVDIANVKALTSQGLLTDITSQIDALPYKS